MSNVINYHPSMHWCVFWLFIVFSFSGCSPFVSVNKDLQTLSDKLYLQKSTLPVQEIGVFSHLGDPGYSELLKITEKDWIDPYGLLTKSTNDLIPGSIQEQVFHEMLSGRSPHPLLQILQKGNEYYF